MKPPTPRSTSTTTPATIRNTPVDEELSEDDDTFTAPVSPGAASHVLASEAGFMWM